MRSDRRADVEIRSEIAVEREQLADALADLREGIAAKRRPAAVLGTVLAAGLAVLTAIRIGRRFRR